MNRTRLGVFFLLLCISLEIEKCKSCGAGPSRATTNGPIKPLILKQKQPDLPEVSEGASGAPTGKITKNSPRYKQLIQNVNPNIIFKDEEGTGADRYMSKMQEEIGRSWNQSEKRWPDLKLRVIEAWDEDNHHTENSLHYEGRAVDISTSDRDRSKYGILGKLAVEAGFDWVVYEARSHIHASVREDSAEDDIHGGCFSGNSTVRLENGRTARMSELQVGDRVASRDENGHVVYSDVLLFLDHKPKLESDLLYFIIETDSPKAKLAITPNHLIYTQDVNFTNVEPIIKYARFLRQGEHLYIENNGKLTLAQVTRIHTEFLPDAYAPLTSHGNIIVDKVLSSCYSLVKDHDIAQTIFAPVRFLHALTPSFLLDSSNQNGLHWLSQLLYKINLLLNYIGIDFL